MLDPVTEAFTPKVATTLAGLKLSGAAQERIDLLAEKCNEGSITPAEHSEYESYVHALDLISIRQAKAGAMISVGQ